MHPLDARASGTSATRAIGTIPAHAAKSFRSPVSDVRYVAELSTSRRSASVSRPSCCRRRRRRTLEVDPEPELVLEFDKAAELTELLGVLFAAES